MAIPQPAFIRDNPIMGAMFASFMTWIWDQDGAHAAFCEATGHPPLSPANTPIDAAIDEATGFLASYTAAFVKWAITEHWGAEGDPRLDDEAA